MKGINYFTAYELRHWPNDTDVGKDEWTPARPIGLGGLRRRLRMAWSVFTGKCDVVKWYRQ